MVQLTSSNTDVSADAKWSVGTALFQRQHRLLALLCTNSLLLDSLLDNRRRLNISLIRIFLVLDVLCSRTFLARCLSSLVLRVVIVFIDVGLLGALGRRDGLRHCNFAFPRNSCSLGGIFGLG